MKRVTESNSNYSNLEQLSTLDLLTNINKEDQLVALAVEKEIPAIEEFIEACLLRMKNNGRLFLYWGWHEWSIRRC